MSRPKLPSQQHPDYPKAKRWTEDGRDYLKPAPLDAFTEFYRAHPEFDKEGEYEFRCPFCGDANSYVDQGGYCCGEVGHCEWVYIPHEEET